LFTALLSGQFYPVLITLLRHFIALANYFAAPDQIFEQNEANFFDENFLLD